MQIYFLGAISALEKSAGDYIKMVDFLESRNNIVWHEHILNRLPDQKDAYPIKKDVDYYEIAINRIKHSDAMFAEVSYPTANVGYELAYALGICIPVHAFYKKGAQIPTMIAASSDPNLKLYEYDDDTIYSQLENALEDLSFRSLNQIVLPISEHVKKYLNWASNKYSVSRSTFIRSLIEAKMLKDKDYKKDYL